MFFHLFECVGATLLSMDTNFAILTLGPSEKTSEISSAFASKKTRKRNELGRLLFKSSSFISELTSAILPPLIS